VLFTTLTRRQSRQTSAILPKGSYFILPALLTSSRVNFETYCAQIAGVHSL
jgi:hypothetical protein